MLRAIVVSPEAELAETLAREVGKSGEIGLVRSLDRYPEGAEVPEILRAVAPEVIFLSVAALNTAFEVARLAEAAVPGIQIVGIHRSCSPPLLLELMRAGIREFLPIPFPSHELAGLLARLNEAVSRKPPAFASTDQVFAFLPSKAGVGASTLALNAAIALSRRDDSRTLLVDADLNSGMQRFMLKLENERSLLDACRSAANLDEILWRKLVAAKKNLDVLHSGRMNIECRIETSQLRSVLAFARRQYRAIVLDLSGNMERFSIDLMHQVKRVYLVTTPEIPPLHLAKEKLAFFRDAGLSGQVVLLLNRVNRRDAITSAQVEDLLGKPVALQLRNDYIGVHRALAAAGEVNPASDLGKTFAELARSMVEEQAPKPKKRFIEFFSITERT